MTFISSIRTDLEPALIWIGPAMEHTVMTRLAEAPDDETVFHFPDGLTLPPVPPGETLAEEMLARGLTATALALKLRVPSNRLTEIIRGRRAISAETALRLGRYLGTGATFWVELQARYDLAVAERDHGDTIAREVEPAGSAP